MKLTFLGTGTSFGVPVIGCECRVCKSADPKDSRLRTSALLENEDTRLLIDCGPDFRQQILRLPYRKIDAVLMTHAHYDHAGGIDDLRPYCRLGDISIYGNEDTCKSLKANLPYCFTENLYPGVPKLTLHTISTHKALKIGSIEVLPIEVMHGSLPILGYRFGKLAYITDMKYIKDAELAYLHNIDTLIINALRWEEEHHSHQLVNDAIAFSQKIKAKTTYLIHLTDKIGLHKETEKILPNNIHLAYDSLELSV